MRTETKKYMAAETARLRAGIDALDAEYSHEQFQRIVYRCTGYVPEGDPVSGTLRVYKGLSLKETGRHYYRGNWWGVKGVYLRPARISVKSKLHYNWALARRVMMEIKKYKEVHGE